MFLVVPKPPKVLLSILKAWIKVQGALVAGLRLPYQADRLLRHSHVIPGLYISRKDLDRF